MTARHASAAKRERQAATALGGKRVTGVSRYKRRPDVYPIALPGGETLQVESKERASLPHLITRAITQAALYTSGAIPVIAVFKKGTRAGIACLPLDALAQLLGLDVDTLPSPTPLRRGPRSPLQGELFPDKVKR